MRPRALFILTALLPVALLAADDFPRGQIIENVECLADAAQSYALYLPSNYTPGKRWSVIVGLDAGGRGRNPVAQFQEAAEKYGYIVAGSKNSRNGPVNVSVSAANAVWTDVLTRFSVDPKRLYLTGQSGGARVAMYLATHKEAFPTAPAGVIASSAFFPGDEPPTSLAFPVFGTAGTEDFNHLEMKQFDRQLESTHRLAIFDGGHMWLPIPLATEAIEWMELQAMKSGLRPRDDAFISSLFALRVKQADALPKGLAARRAYTALAADFNGLRDVRAYAARATQLSKDSAVRKAFDEDAKIDEQEGRLSSTLQGLAQQLGSTLHRANSLAQLRARTMELHAKPDATADSLDRQLARRVLRGFIASARGSQDAALDALLEEIRPAAGRF
jgi:dienelactone hydrolase